ncbi:MAG: cobalamin-dependent protein [Desulfomicrobium escambiense]|nr:cobalamin-dependent protein [Desulfomicrobium escambiense]
MIETDPDAIATTLLAAAPDLVAFSVYLWNVGIVKRVATAIRAQSKAWIVAGGPEVAHDAWHFLSSFPFDFVIRGEGERAFARLATALADESDYRDIPNLAFRDGATVRINPIEAIADLAGPRRSLPVRGGRSRPPAQDPVSRAVPRLARSPARTVSRRLTARSGSSRLTASRKRSAPAGPRRADLQVPRPHLQPAAGHRDRPLRFHHRASQGRRRLPARKSSATSSRDRSSGI